MDLLFEFVRVEVPARQPKPLKSPAIRERLFCSCVFRRARRRVAALGAPLFLLLWMIPKCAFAQGPQSNARQESGSAPANAHWAAVSAVVPVGAEVRSAEGAATVDGAVLDESGAIVSGAQVSLLQDDGTPVQQTASGANGEFSFTKIHAGSFLVSVSADGFAPYTSEEFALKGQQIYEVPDFELSVAAANTMMIVHPTEFIAAEQMRAAEKQRLIGVIPNFYTSYTYDTAPLTAKQKFIFATRGTFDPVAMAGVGFAAGIEQATNTYAGYGQGMQGYAKRFGAKFADGRSSDYFTHAIYPSLFRQDPRYYYQGSGSAKSRVLHAIGSAFFTRTDSGRTAPNYSFLLGDLSSGALSNLYYPQANRGASLMLTNAAVGLGGRMAGNILREFSRRMTTNAGN